MCRFFLCDVSAVMLSVTAPYRTGCDPLTGRQPAGCGQQSKSWHQTLHGSRSAGWNHSDRLLRRLQASGHMGLRTGTVGDSKTHIQQRWEGEQIITVDLSWASWWCNSLAKSLALSVWLQCFLLFENSLLDCPVVVRVMDFVVKLLFANY